MYSWRVYSSAILLSVKNIDKIYLAQLLSGFAMITSLSPLYFLAHGVSQSQLGILISANILTLAIFDIPTGAIADTFGHKTSVFLGTLIWSLSYLMLYFATGFPIFLASMIVGGVGLALVSGAFTSLVYDILDKQGIQEDFRKVYGRSDSSFLISSVIAATAGGFIYQYQPNLIFLVAFLFTLVASFVFLGIDWNFTGKTPSVSIYISNITQGILFTLRNKSLVALVIVSIGLSFGVYVVNNIKQPFLIQAGYNVVQLGIFTAFISGMSALIYANGYMMLKRLGNLKTLVIISVIASASLIITSLSGPIISLVLLMIFQLLPSLRDPALMHLQQKHIIDGKRATMNSTVSSLSRVIIALALPLWGMLIDSQGMNSSLLYLGILTGVITTAGFLSYRLYSR
jgi:MFS family permease